MESNTKRIIIIGGLIFLAIVVVTLSIVLPLTLKNRGAKNKNSTDSQPNTTSSSLITFDSTNTMVVITDGTVQTETEDAVNAESLSKNLGLKLSVVNKHEIRDEFSNPVSATSYVGLNFPGTVDGMSDGDIQSLLLFASIVYVFWIQQ